MQRKILVLDGKGSEYDAPFKHHGRLFHEPQLIEDMDLVVFTGGEDVSPDLYGDKVHPSSMINGKRDQLEQTVFNQAYIMSIPMVGICRGAQFLNVMNHGHLIQNVNGHSIGGTHPVHTKDGRTIQVTSTHHQLIVPANNAEVLAWSEGLISMLETGGTLNPQELLTPYKLAGGLSKEPDVVFWERTNALGVQYHPEYMNPDSGGWLYFQELLNKYIFRT